MTTTIAGLPSNNASASDVLKGFNVGASNGQDLPYPEPGRYRLKIAKCKAIKRWDGIAMYIVEFDVLTSSATETGKQAHPAGAKFAWIQRLDHQPAAKNLTMFAASALGVAPKDVTLDHLIAFCDEKDGHLPGGILAVAGVQIDVLFFSGQSKKGNPITKCNISPVVGKTLAAVTVGK